MAGKLCGPSSSKASPASTPIPLGTAKHKTLKRKKKEYNTHTETHTHTYIRTHAHTHCISMYTNTFDRNISREKVLALLQKHSLSSKQE